MSFVLGLALVSFMILIVRKGKKKPESKDNPLTRRGLRLRGYSIAARLGRRG
jgi:hypothetical protein